MVWISSGALQFRCDKTKPLGMTAPQWCKFNANTLVNQRTRFYFRVPGAEHREIIRNDLLGLKPELLLFLRQLRVIEIRIQDQFGVFEIHIALIGTMKMFVESDLQRSRENPLYLSAIRVIGSSSANAPLKHS